VHLFYTTLIKTPNKAGVLLNLNSAKGLNFFFKDNCLPPVEFAICGYVDVHVYQHNEQARGALLYPA
jgi:hypothetical protein